jgi:DNA-binding GntR family transcriptional regulator
VKEDEAQKASREGQNVGLVHDLLRSEILSGRIPAGETSQVALARELEVGRTPLREALRMLQREGLVLSEPNRRVRIAELSATDAEELFVMRSALEAAAVRITVPAMGSEGVAELEGLMAQMDHYEREGDEQGLKAPHRAFHARLVDAAGERVEASISLLADHAERYQVATGAAETPDERRSTDHREIADAAADGDADLTVRRVLEHYGRGAATILARLDPDYRPARLGDTLEALAPGSERALEGTI